MRPCRKYELRLLEVVGQTLALLPCQNLFKSGRILVDFMLDMLVEVRHEGFEKGEEVLAVGGHVLDFVEIFLDLMAISQGLVPLNRDTHSHMLLAVHVGQLLSLLTKLLLHDRIHGQLLTDCMASESPGELVPPLDFLL